MWENIFEYCWPFFIMKKQFLREKPNHSCIPAPEEPARKYRHYQMTAWESGS